MSTSVSRKAPIDLPVWRPLAFQPATHAAGSSLAYDESNKDPRPYVYYLNSASQFYAYNTKTNGYLQFGSPALAGTF